MQRNIEIENKIIEIFKQYKQIKIKTIKKIFKNNIIIRNYCMQLLQIYPEYINMLNLINSIVLNIQLPHCKTCNKLMNFNQRNGKYCSHKCSSIDPQNIEKGKIKFKQTCLKKFGVQTPLKNNECKQKSKHTILKKYGVQNVMQNQQIKEKVLNTMIQKYGSHSSKNKNVIAKLIQTNNKKYGGNAPACNKNVQEKIKNTMLQKYNVTSVMLSPELKEKVHKTCLQKFNSISPIWK